MKLKCTKEVVIPKYVADAIKTMKNKNISDIDIITDVYMKDYWGDKEIDQAINNIVFWLVDKEENKDMFVQAVTIGYNVEQSKLDKFYEFYNELDLPTKDLIKKALSILEINMNDYV